jgi:hypothetical protein
MTREDRGASSFDELAVGLSSGTLSRGKALKLMGAALVGGTLASLGVGEASAVPRCKPAGKRCKNGTQCCSGTCGEDRKCTAMTPGACTAGTAPCCPSCENGANSLCYDNANGMGTTCACFFGPTCTDDCSTCGGINSACVSSPECQDIFGLPFRCVVPCT